MNNFSQLLSQNLDSIALDISSLNQDQQQELNSEVLEFIDKKFYYSDSSFDYSKIQSLETYEIIFKIIDFLHIYLNNGTSTKLDIPVDLQPYLANFIGDNFNFNLSENLKNIKLCTPTNINSNFLF